MTRYALLIAPLALLALAGCNEERPGSNAVSKAPAARVVGEAVDCVSIASMNGTTVHDDYTIDFKVGSRTYRNTLPYRCSGLGLEKAFSYETSLSQLCSTDMIHVLRSTGGTPDRGASCGLGRFVPVELEK